MHWCLLSRCFKLGYLADLCLVHVHAEATLRATSATSAPRLALGRLCCFQGTPFSSAAAAGEQLQCCGTLQTQGTCRCIPCRQAAAALL